MNIWRINIRERTLSQEPVPAPWERLGGRGLTARVLVDEVPAGCEPLGEYNKLIFAPGLLAGQMLSSCDRISVGAKSPLTGGIKESNGGGRTGLKMARLGIKALVVEGRPEAGGWWVVHLSRDGARFEPGDDLAGLGVYEATPVLLARYGEKAAIALIGPGGERLLHSAGVQNIDRDGVPSRIAARGGLGAVMGSKRIKAIVFDDAGCSKPELQDATLYKDARSRLNEGIKAHPQSKTYADYGTQAMVQMCNAFGGLPTRGFSAGSFEGAEAISGERMRELLLERGGEAQTTHACMAGCMVRCSNCYAGPDGKAIVAPIEYESVGLMGSNLGIDDLDVVARLNRECNDLGIDTIEVGAALGVAAQAGLMSFGDGQRALELLQEMRRGTPLGRLIGSGAATVGKVLGVEPVPSVKGQAMAAYDPRAIKGTGVTYATSPQGADHTCGATVRANIDHLDPKAPQVETSRNAQLSMAGYDTLGACLFAGFGFSLAPGAVRDLLNGQYGWDVPDDILQQLGRETLDLERQFNRAAGFSAVHDRLPEWMKREALPPKKAVFDIPDEDLDTVFNW
jgi:aldehyde:ferredoxin oxidoreductase